MWVTEVRTQDPNGKRIKLMVEFDTKPTATDIQDVKTNAQASHRRAYGEFYNKSWEKTWEVAGA